ncbi:uncharacterized protein LOC106075004 [Biomphalaria glabrata]|uniref:Uncharacterized protein LOC106075004 n=1 Tax=Biomphalaria glabrata TaxID=6526 RepID=A0A9U8EKG3_BIOGL|nr:uncharacterized protein LOC106075004 [Biomphalaria glabrata]XP_013091371.2 uncharacterized protein LOC106075004 [Biomphalaria glabrata]XP_013091372.2 uncharacterized protein LOC106075004 [Biomphalaria glabrata]
MYNPELKVIPATKSSPELLVTPPKMSNPELKVTPATKSSSELLVTPYVDCLQSTPTEALTTQSQKGGASCTSISASDLSNGNVAAEVGKQSLTLLEVPVPGINISTSSEDEEEITETKIIGVTETGVIRKRSFKRKLTLEEKLKRQFGNDKVDYEKIYDSVLTDRFIVGAVEMLQERWKMLRMMHDDCQEMMSHWERRCQEKRHAHQVKRDVDTIIAVAILSFLLLFLAFIIHLVLW